MQKILIITPYMVPFAPIFGSCQRIYYLAEYLQDSGLDITVISSKEKWNPIYAKNINFTAIYKGNFRLSKLNLIDKIGKLAIVDKNVFSGYSKNSIEVLRWVQKYKHYICNYVSRNKIDKVILSVPYFPLLFLAPCLKKASPNIKIIFDYRDPWSTWNHKKRIHYFIEKYMLQYADLIVTALKPVELDMIKFFDLKVNTATITNGYSENAWQGINKQNNINGQMIVSHVGSISFGRAKSFYRNPDPLLEAFTSIAENRNIILQFVGIGDEKDAYMKDMEEKTKGKIRFIPNVPIQESFEYMVNSDVVLVINQSDDYGSKHVVGAKFYDYVRSQSFIWNIGEKEGYLSKLINKYQFGITTENNVNELKHTLCDLYRRWEKDILNREENEAIKKFSREYQNEKYRKFITNL